MLNRAKPIANPTPFVRDLSAEKRACGVFIFRKCLKTSGAPMRSCFRCAGSLARSLGARLGRRCCLQGCHVRPPARRQQELQSLAKCSVSSAGAVQESRAFRCRTLSRFAHDPVLSIFRCCRAKGAHQVLRGPFEFQTWNQKCAIRSLSLIHISEPTRPY